MAVSSRHEDSFCLAAFFSFSISFFCLFDLGGLFCTFFCSLFATMITSFTSSHTMTLSGCCSLYCNKFAAYPVALITDRHDRQTFLLIV